MLRERTADLHRRLEDSLDLASPDLDADRLYDVLSRFHAFWKAAEPELDGWARREPALAATLDWPRRRRTARLAADLALLAARTGRADEAPATEPALLSPDTAQVLGWLYVSEGSTLGGAVITARLRTPTRHRRPAAALLRAVRRGTAADVAGVPGRAGDLDRRRRAARRAGRRRRRCTPSPRSPSGLAVLSRDAAA